jgi:hypothetical protein
MESRKRSQNGKKGGFIRELTQVGLAVMAGGSAVVVTGVPDDHSGGTEWSWQLSANCWLLAAGRLEQATGSWFVAGGWIEPENPELPLRGSRV